MPLKHKHTLQHHRDNHRPKGVSKQAFEKVYWPYIPILLVAVLAIVFSNASQTVTQAQPNRKVLSYATSMSIGGLLSATNSERASNGSGALSLNSKLNSAAQNKANDMAARNYWSHNTPEGSPPWIFVNAQGYSYQKIGENLAAGFSTENAAIQGWMNSPAHKTNMLDPVFTEVGFGFANNANYTSGGGGEMTIVVAFYGKPVAAAAPAPSASSGSSQPAAKAATPAATPAAATPAPVETPVETAKEADSVKAPAKEASAPVTTAQAVPAVSPTKKVKRIELTLGNTLPSRIVSSASIALIGGLIALWALKHAIFIRRYLATGERFVIHHPIIDITILGLILLIYFMSRTVGLVQ